MLFDFSNHENLPLAAKDYIGGRCLLNGVEIHQVWYVDTDQGIVRTYDVCGDKQPHPGPERPAGCCPDAELMRGVWSVELHGHIKLLRP